MHASPLSDPVSSLRFTKPDWHSSGIKLKGIARIDTAALVLEYHEISSHTGRPKQRGGLEGFLHRIRHGEPLSPESRTIVVPFSDLDYSAGRNWFFFSTVTISTDRLSVFSSIPGSHQGRLRLLTSWGDRHRGKRFVTHLNLRLAEWRMAHAEEAGGGSAREERFKVL